MIWTLIWFTVIPEVGVSYHHLGNFANETVCMAELRIASVLVNDPTETIECIGVKLND
tara:strand:+ start:5828 stop:6001 length:174 start_codon:yes stop_codon:yes gene_type:complete